MKQAGMERKILQPGQFLGKKKHSPLEGVEHTLAQQRKIRSSISHALEQFEPIDMALDDSIVPIRGQSSFDSGVVMTHPCDKTVQFWAGGGESLLHPVRERFSAVMVDHLLETLDKLIEVSQVRTVV